MRIVDLEIVRQKIKTLTLLGTSHINTIAPPHTRRKEGGPTWVGVLLS